jgi:hypothetical protein
VFGGEGNNPFEFMSQYRKLLIEVKTLNYRQYDGLRFGFQWDFMDVCLL